MTDALPGRARRPGIVGCYRCGAVCVGVASCPRCPAPVVLLEPMAARTQHAPVLAFAALVVIAVVLAWVQS